VKGYNHGTILSIFEKVPITTAEGLLAEYNHSALFRHLEELPWGMVIEDAGIVIPGQLESVGV